MGYGIRVYNQSGILLIDSDQRIPFLHYVTTINVTADPFQFSFSFPYLTRIPVVLYKSDYHINVKMSLVYTDSYISGISGKIYVNQDDLYNAGSISVTFSVYKLEL